MSWFTRKRPTGPAYMAEQQKKLSSLREKGEGVMMATTAASGVLTGTTVGVAAATAAGVTGVAVSFPPVAAGLLALSMLVGTVIRHVGINTELGVNFIAIQHEVDRIYNIYRVIEEIAKENRLPLQVSFIQRYTRLITENILLLAGPNAIEEIESKYKTVNTTTELAKLREELLTERKSQQRGWRGWLRFGKRVVIPGEMLRIIIRDVTILTVFFSILQSEFDLLMRAHGDPNRRDWVKSNAYRAFFQDLPTAGTVVPKPSTLEEMNSAFKALEDAEEATKQIIEESGNSAKTILDAVNRSALTIRTPSETPTSETVSLSNQNGGKRRRGTQRRRGSRK